MALFVRLFWFELSRCEQFNQLLLVLVVSYLLVQLEDLFLTKTRVSIGVAYTYLIERFAMYSVSSGLLGVGTDFVIGPPDPDAY